MFKQLYFERYSEILGVDIEILKKVGELCEIYDEEKEICQIKNPQLT